MLFPKVSVQSECNVFVLSKEIIYPHTQKCPSPRLVTLSKLEILLIATKKEGLCFSQKYQCKVNAMFEFEFSLPNALYILITKSILHFNNFINDLLQLYVRCIYYFPWFKKKLYLPFYRTLLPCSLCIFFFNVTEKHLSLFISSLFIFKISVI